MCISIHEYKILAQEMRARDHILVKIMPNVVTYSGAVTDYQEKILSNTSPVWYITSLHPERCNEKDSCTYSCKFTLHIWVLNSI